MRDVVILFLFLIFVCCETVTSPPCNAYYVRWPRVRLNFKSVANARLSLRACESACSLGEDPQLPGRSLECAALNHHPAPDGFAHQCDVFQPHQLQNVDGYVEADDRYSFYWKYCLNSTRRCGGEYAFTYLSDRYMDSRDVIRVAKKNSLEDCLVECLDERAIPCRSISFNRTDGGCHLSADSQLTKPKAIRLNNNPNFRIDYYENNCYNLSDTFKFEQECREDGIFVKVKSKFPYTGALYGLYDFFTCRIEPKELIEFGYLFPSPTASRNCSDSIRFQGDEMVLDVVLSTDGIEPLYFITPDDLTYQARCPIVGKTTSATSNTGETTRKEEQQKSTTGLAHTISNAPVRTAPLKTSPTSAKLFKPTYPLPLITTEKTQAPFTIDAPFKQVVQQIIRTYLAKSSLSDENLLTTSGNDGLISEKERQILAQLDPNNLLETKFQAPIVDFFANLSTNGEALKTNDGAAKSNQELTSTTAVVTSTTDNTTEPSFDTVEPSAFVSKSEYSDYITTAEPKLVPVVTEAQVVATEMSTPEFDEILTTESSGYESSGTTEDIEVTTSVFKDVTGSPGGDAQDMYLRKALVAEGAVLNSLKLSKDFLSPIHASLSQKEPRNLTLRTKTASRVTKQEAAQDLRINSTASPYFKDIEDMQLLIAPVKEKVSEKTTKIPPSFVDTSPWLQEMIRDLLSDAAAPPTLKQSHTSAVQFPTSRHLATKQINISVTANSVAATNAPQMTTTTVVRKMILSERLTPPSVSIVGKATSSLFSETLPQQGTKKSFANQKTLSLPHKKIFPLKKSSTVLESQTAQHVESKTSEAMVLGDQSIHGSSKNKGVISRSSPRITLHHTSSFARAPNESTSTPKATLAADSVRSTAVEIKLNREEVPSVLSLITSRTEKPKENLMDEGKKHNFGERRRKTKTISRRRISQKRLNNLPKVMTEVAKAALQIKKSKIIMPIPSISPLHRETSKQIMQTFTNGSNHEEHGNVFARKTFHRNPAKLKKKSKKSNFFLRRRSLMIPIKIASTTSPTSGALARTTSNTPPTAKSVNQSVLQMAMLLKKIRQRKALKGVKIANEQQQEDAPGTRNHFIRKPTLTVKNGVVQRVVVEAFDPLDEIIPLLENNRLSERVITLLRLFAASMQNARMQHFNQRRVQKRERIQRRQQRRRKIALVRRRSKLRRERLIPLRKEPVVLLENKTDTPRQLQVSLLKQESFTHLKKRAKLNTTRKRPTSLELQRERPENSTLVKEEVFSPIKRPTLFRRQPQLVESTPATSTFTKPWKPFAKGQTPSTKHNTPRKALRAPSTVTAPHFLRTHRPRTTTTTKITSAPPTTATTPTTTTTKPTTTTTTKTTTVTTEQPSTIMKATATTTKLTTQKPTTTTTPSTTTTTNTRAPLNRSPALHTAGPPAPSKPSEPTKPVKGAVSFDIFHNGQPVEAVVVGTKIMLSFTPLYAIPPEYMSVQECQVEPIDSKYEWEREPLPIIRDGCQADLVGLVCPPKQSEFGIKISVESFRYQSTPYVQYSCLVRICPFAPCVPTNCPSVDGCPREKRAARSLSLEEIRRALEADPKLASQIGISPHMLANRPGHSVESQLLALGGDHTVKRRLVVVNSEDQLRYYVRTGDVS